MFFRRKREQEVEKLFITHFKLIQKVLFRLERFFSNYFKGDRVFKKDALDIHNTEHEADTVRREIEIKLYQGAFLPVYRADYLILADRADKIANQAELVSDYVMLTRPNIPDFIREDLLNLIKTTISTYTPLMETLENFYKDMKTVIDLSFKVSQKEQEVDKIEWDITKKVFKSDLDLSHKLHLKHLIDHIGMISNQIEDTADRFDIMIVKRKM
jgi:hypothetical protein